MRNTLITVFLMLAIISTTSGQVGISMDVITAYEYGISFDESPTFQALSRNSSSAYTIGGALGIHWRFLNIRPAFEYAFSGRTLRLENRSGDWLPLGTSLDLPWVHEDSGWTYYTYTDIYNYQYADVDISLWRAGAFLSVSLVEGFEFGSGLFLKKQINDITVYAAQDEYFYTGSTGTTWDHYSYSDTYLYWDRGNSFTRIERQFAIPLYLQYSYEFPNTYSGAGFMVWFSDDVSFSFRYIMTIPFLSKTETIF